MNHITRSEIFAHRGQMDAALAEAREAYQSAIMDAQTVEPVFQADTLQGLEKSLRSLN